MTHQVPHNYKEGERLRHYLLGKLPQLLTNSAIKKAIAAGRILVNSQIGTTGYIVQADDSIQYLIPQPQVHDLPAIDIAVLYEDEHLAILCKPAGLVASGNQKRTFANYLPVVLQSSAQHDALPVPLLVHRLDRATTGLIIAAKTYSCRISLGHMLSEGSVQKVYAAVVQGYAPVGERSIAVPIDSQQATTVIKKVQHLATIDPTSLITMHLLTGRTHQIRKHMLHIGHPIVGDQLYNKAGLSFGSGLLLAAMEVRLLHPVQGNILEVTTPLPQKLAKYLQR